MHSLRCPRARQTCGPHTQSRVRVSRFDVCTAWVRKEGRRRGVAAGAQAPATTVKRPPFPFTRIAGQEEMKQALILNVIDPNIGGVLIMGDRGTGKSVAVRPSCRCCSLPVALLPTVMSSCYLFGGAETSSILNPMWWPCCCCRDCRIGLSISSLDRPIYQSRGTHRKRCVR